jgi:hypothetical protein
LLTPPLSLMFLHSTESKIAMMEAKLKQMEAESTGASTSLAPHPGLPPKPPVADQAAHTVAANTTSLAPERQSEPRPSVTRLLGPSYHPASSSTLNNRTKVGPRSNSGLTGVRIGKSKAKDKDKMNESPATPAKGDST